jgi:hypothetical protein
MHLHHFYIYFELFGTIYIAYIVARHSFIQFLVDDIVGLKEEINSILYKSSSQLKACNETVETLEKGFGSDHFIQQMASKARVEVDNLNLIFSSQEPAIRNKVEAICKTYNFSNIAFFISFYCVTFLVISGIIQSHHAIKVCGSSLELLNILFNLNLITYIYLISTWASERSEEEYGTKWELLYNRIKNWVFWKWKIFKPLRIIPRFSQRIFGKKNTLNTTILMAFITLLLSTLIEWVREYFNLVIILREEYIIAFSIGIPILNLVAYYLIALLRAFRIRGVIRTVHPILYDITTSVQFQNIQTIQKTSSMF